MGCPTNAQYFLGGNLARRPPELIATARAADALEYALAYQRLQDRLQMSPRKSVAVCQRPGADWLAARMQRNIEHSRDSEHTFTR